MIELGTLKVQEGIEGLIFDCDGTLVDSMPLHMFAWRAAFDQLEAALDEKFLFSLKGMKEIDIVQLYNRKFGTKLDPGGVVDLKHAFLLSRLPEIKAIDIVADLARSYQGKLPMAVASGSPSHIVIPELEQTGLKDLFTIILTADDGATPKPDPGIFLEAAGQLGIAPEHCQVFEDGELGLQAALNAGMLATDIRPFL